MALVNKDVAKNLSPNILLDDSHMQLRLKIRIIDYIAICELNLYAITHRGS